MVEEKKEEDIEKILAERYRKDLDFLQDFNAMAITDRDINVLQNYADKYKLKYQNKDVKVDVQNFNKIKGSLLRIIQELLEVFVIEHHMARKRATSPTKILIEDKYKQVKREVHL